MNNNSLWSLAAKNGMILSLITIVIELLKTVVTMKPIWSTLLSLVKLGLIIYLLYYFMKKYAQDKDYVSYSESFRYGFFLTFCSAIVCTLFYLVLYLVIAPDIIETAMDTFSSVMGNQSFNFDFDMDQLSSVLPTAIGFSQLITCTLWGLVLSAIVANFTKKGDIFSTNSSDSKSEE